MKKLCKQREINRAQNDTQELLDGLDLEDRALNEKELNTINQFFLSGIYLMGPSTTEYTCFSIMQETDHMLGHKRRLSNC